MITEKIIDIMGIKCHTMLADVQTVIDTEKDQYLRAKAGNMPYFDSYHPWEEVHQYIDDLALEFPNLASVSTIGKTYEGRPMKVITISTDRSAKKPTLWFDGGMHAREWVSVSTVTFLADAIIRSASTNSSLLDTYDVIICPIINIDGYAWTWAEDGDRMWRKTRSPNPNQLCVGTDANRNFGYHWGEAGASDRYCSDIYHGPSPASEIEVSTLQDTICGLNHTIVGYVDFHSYSQLWMSSWSYTDEVSPDYDQQNGLSAAAVAAIKDTHGVTYGYGPTSVVISTDSGCVEDYTYGVCGIKYSYSVELRDTGKYGFLLPADQIVPTGEEIYAAVMAMGEYIQANP